MNRLFFESYLRLVKIDLLMRFGNLRSIHELVRKCQVGHSAAGTRSGAQEICHGVDLACVFYFKKVLCLQRSVATTLVLRHHGYRAEMVIGAQMLPFKSHAWVEIDGNVVNDKPYMLDIYQVLERC